MKPHYGLFPNRRRIRRPLIEIPADPVPAPKAEPEKPVAEPVNIAPIEAPLPVAVPETPAEPVVDPDPVAVPEKPIEKPEPVKAAPAEKPKGRNRQKPVK